MSLHLYFFYVKIYIYTLFMSVYLYIYFAAVSIEALKILFQYIFIFLYEKMFHKLRKYYISFLKI